MADHTTTLCGICICVVVLTAIALVVTSFSSLEATEYGLDYSSITKSISSDSMSGGMHFLGIGHSFIKFPKTVQTIEFSNSTSYGSLASRSSDGLEVILEISFQYVLTQNNLSDLYYAYALDYQSVFVLVAMDILSAAATNYTAYNFFMSRDSIGTSMQDSLNTAFQTYCFASIEYFQLLSVDLPDDFETAISDTEVEKQDIATAEAELTQAEVELNTTMLSAQYNANSTIITAEGEADARVIENNSTAAAFELVQETKADAYSTLMTDLDLNSTELLEYLKATAIRDYDSSNITLNLDGTTF